MKFKYLLAASVAGLSAVQAVPAAAQSTGALDFEEDAIVVTGTRDVDVSGIEIPDTPKAKQVLDEEIIRRQRPGQTVNDIINLVPGVSFQNNDPWGSSGGGFTIRGFGADRVSQTVDGIPLNDSGNYALYTNQQQDPETLESVSVNLGTTDVDSPTASAAGGTINILTREPGEEFGFVGTASYGNVYADGSSGDRPYLRAFGMIDTGDFTGFGTRAFVSASTTEYDNPFNNYGKVKKQQYNARIWQDIGADGDFVAISGHYNENRNNFFGSFGVLDLRDMVESGDGEARFYDINFPCSLPAGTVAGGGGVNGTAQGYSDSSSTPDCGAEFDRRYNPSNTGNIRGASRFTLSDALTLTVDPSYQYVKANGGGPEDLKESFRNIGGVNYTGFLGGSYHFGRDLNGDGDILDEVGGIDPSQTVTNRFGVISSLAYEISPEHRVRVAYTLDHARHRQTGQTGFMAANGEPLDVFPINDPVLTSDGFALNKRDRLSYAILNQISGEYRGEFANLTVLAGVRLPFFTRELNQNCYTTTESGFVDCFSNQDSTAYEAANPDAAPPQSRTYKYDKLLPNVGLTYDLGAASVFANYAKGLSVPGTDPLYDSLFLADVRESQPVPETTDSFDLGMRFRQGRLTAQLAGWYTRYNNRLATAFDPILEEFLFRNLGRVDKWGVDGSVAWNPTQNTLLYLFGSYSDSEIKEDVQAGFCDDDDVDDGVPGCSAEGDPRFLATAGSRESGSPKFTLGARGQVSLGPVDFGVQAKHTGKRFVNDLNLESVPSYTLVDMDVRLNIGEFAPGKEAALQLNVTNLFDELYVGFFSGSLDGVPFAQIGSPRAASISFVLGY